MCVMAGLLIYALFQSSWLRSENTFFIKFVRAVVGVLGILTVVSLYGWVAWPPIHRHVLAQNERAKFEEPLKGKQSPEMSIQMACAPGDEIDCEYAEQLIPLFGESGWKVSGEVERVMLARPQPGIILGLHGGDPKTERNWDAGAWMAMTPTLEHVMNAFQNIGICPDSTSGSIIPEGQINIYVGHERDNETEPTSLTTNFEKMKEYQKTGVWRR
jgi:hypothetical protein